MSANPIIIRLRCMDCGNFVNPGEVVRIGEATVQCWACYDRQRVVMESWAEPPKECALCHVAFAELIARTPGKPVSMFPHWIDGTMGLLCKPCDLVYVQKRKDQFGDTRFGWDRKLK